MINCVIIENTDGPVRTGIDTSSAVRHLSFRITRLYCTILRISKSVCGLLVG